VLEHILDQVTQCSRCGFCQPTCPTFAISGLEQEVARGRNQLIRGVAEGRLPFDKNLASPVFQCLMCNACYSNCFPRIKTDRVIAAVRHEYIRRYGQPAIQRLIFTDLLRKPRLLGFYLKMASLGKKTNLTKLVRIFRFLGWYGRNLVNAEGLLEKIPGTFLRSRLESLPLSPDKIKGKIAYFIGCGINFANPDVGYASVQLMLQRGFAVDVIKNYCCGLPAYAYGDLDSVQWFASKNLDLLASTDADYIVTDCGSCTSFLHEYPQFFPDQPEKVQSALQFTKKLVDMTTFLFETQDMARYHSEPVMQKVTYHDPCHLAHYLGEKNAPRHILKSLPGVDFVELPESDFCCGGAGSYNIAHYDLSMKILQRKMNNIRTTQAHVVATACPSCIIQLSYGVRQNSVPVKVKHISQIIYEKTRVSQ
jgi:glycolate oxidase iron-sulfur subunit